MSLRRRINNFHLFERLSYFPLFECLTREKNTLGSFEILVNIYPVTQSNVREYTKLCISFEAKRLPELSTNIKNLSTSQQEQILLFEIILTRIF